MDGDELGRHVARQEAEGRAHGKPAVVRQSLPEATAATAAGCVARAKEPLRRFDALRRRRPEPEPLPIWWAAARRTGDGNGPLARGR